MIIVVIAVILVIVSVGLKISNSDSGNDNNGEQVNPGDGKRWEDLTSLRKFLNQNYTVKDKRNSDTAIINSISDPGDTVWIIVGVEKEFTSSEASAVRKFVQNGGTLILASESTFCNKISRSYGINYSGYNILDDNFDKNKIFIPSTAKISGSTYEILTNGPKGLEIDKDVKNIDFNVIASSSEYQGFGKFSFLDKNGNGEADADDALGPIEIIIEAQFEKGKFFFIGNSGIFIDDLWDLERGRVDYRNRQFTEALLKRSISDQGTVIYDFSKHIEIQSGHLLYP